MGAVTCPDERVSSFINENFVPVQINTVDHPEFTDRLLERWTPVVFFMDAEGRTHRKQVGYTPPEGFVADLLMGLAQVTFDNRSYDEAAEQYQRIVDEHPKAEAAPEALYRVGVSKYRATDDGSYLDKYFDMVMEDYPATRWAKAADI